MVKSTVPMMLNIRWMMVVRLALRLVPMAASTAVIQVPIFWPNSTYTALGRVISPLVASACRIPTEAEEDCIIAVKKHTGQNPQHRIGKSGHQLYKRLRIPKRASSPRSSYPFL